MQKINNTLKLLTCNNCCFLHSVDGNKVELILHSQGPQKGAAKECFSFVKLVANFVEHKLLPSALRRL